jgi:uncharacterized protein YndB with AHSA1/START domain
MEQARAKEQLSLRLNRFFPVEPEKVWRAWTDPQAIKRWFGPGNEPVSVAELDVRVGGRYRLVFGGADGNAHEAAGVYKEVVAAGKSTTGKLVFTWSWPRTTPERVSVVTIVFKAAGGGTELEFRHEQFHDETVRDNHKRGWGAALEKLGEFLKAS